jgi:hypothetical protein
MDDAIFEKALKNEPLTKKAQKQLDAIAAVVPITRKEGSPPQFRQLTGAMLRKLVDAGTVVFRGPDEGWDYDSDVFKGGHDEESLAFLEKYPRFFAQGYVQTSEDGARLSIDTIIGGVETTEDRYGHLYITPHKKPLSKQEIFAFANRFHRADEFELGDNHAHAWFD